MRGWTGKILRVDLARRSVEVEPLNMAWARDFIGGRGLGARYLFAEMDPTVDALSPDNKLIFATGPLKVIVEPLMLPPFILSLTVPLIERTSKLTDVSLPSSFASLSSARYPASLCLPADTLSSGIWNSPSPMLLS